MMKQWTLFPTVLQRKFLLTLLAGIASAGISVIICVATKDHVPPLPQSAFDRQPWHRDLTASQ